VRQQIAGPLLHEPDGPDTAVTFSTLQINDSVRPRPDHNSSSIACQASVMHVRAN
jgi:hypothetical protein